MNELHRELDRLAAGVADDGTADRMLGRVGPMVQAIRRRRAARRTGMGVAAVGSVAAVALLVPGLRPTAGPGPAAATSWSLTAGVECGDPLPALPTDAPLSLVVGFRGTQPGGLYLIEYASNPTLDVQPLERDDQLTLLVVQDGEVAGMWSGTVSLSGALEPWTMGGATGGTFRLTTCRPGSAEGMLTDGAYDVYAVRSDAQGAALGASGPLGLEVDGATTTMAGLTGRIAEVQAALADVTPAVTDDQESSSDPAAEQRLAAAAAVAALRAEGPAAGATFPACATTVPEPDADPLLTVALDGAVDLPASTDPVKILANVSAAGGRAVLANAGVESETGLPAARLVFTRDAVVVGAGYVDPEAVTLLDLEPDRAAPVMTVGRTTVCSSPRSEAAGLPLPAGTYEAYAVLDVALKEVTEADGTATSRSDLVTVVSPPAEVTITAP